MAKAVESVTPTQRVGKGVFFDWPNDLIPDGGAADGQNIEPRGFIPEAGTVGKAPGWAKFSTTAAPGTGPVMLFMDFIKAAGTRNMMAFTTTRAGKYNIGTGVFDDVTAGANLLTATATSPVFGAVLNDLCVVGDEFDAPRKYDGTTWALLGGTPPTCLGWDVFEGHLLGWSTSAVKYRFQWSDLNNPEQWGVGTGESGFLDIRDENLLGIMTGGKMRRQYLLYKEQLGGVYAVNYLGLPTIMEVELVVPKMGVFSPRGVAIHGDVHYVMGSDEKLWALTPSGHSIAQPFTATAPTEIAQGLRKRLFNRINWNARRAAFVAVDPFRDLVIFAIPEGSSTVVSRAYLFNYRTGGTGEMEYPMSTALAMRDPTTTLINQLPGTILSLTGTIDSLGTTGQDIILLGGEGASAFVYKQSGESKDGTAMDSWVATKWAGTGDGRYSRVRGVEGEVTGTFTAEIGTADSIVGPMSFMPLGGFGNQNRADANTSGRWVSARIRSQGMTDTWELSGYRLDAFPLGRR